MTALRPDRSNHQEFGTNGRDRAGIFVATDGRVLPARSVHVRWNIRFPPPRVLMAGLLALAPAVAGAQGRYPSPYPPPFGYRYAGPESHLRLAVTPSEAQVYVDGYLAGSVDEFDGTFQRLHVTPGEHEIVFYLQGYRTIRQHLYLSPNATRKIAAAMEKLDAGETPEPAPAPAPEPPRPPDPDRAPPPERGPFPRGSRFPPRPPTPPEATVPPPSESVRGGALVLRVQPSGANVTIDGTLWDGPSSGNDRLVVQVNEGRHRVEVTRDGYVPFSTEVDVQRGQSLPVNVSLARER
jgi:hypothetical protein